LAHRATLRILGSLAIVVALAGCGTTDPSPIEDEYVLQTLNQSTLPYDHAGLGCCTYLSGGLELVDGRYAAFITARNRNTQAVFTATEQGTYAQQGTTITFARDGFTVQPLLLDVGVVSDNRITVSFGGEGPGSPDQFHAVFVKAP
jgi:hypothetical protein